MIIESTILAVVGGLAGWAMGRRRAAPAAVAPVDVDARQAELRTAIARAERSDRAKSEILANTSHDIRTPLTAILGYAELLQDELPPGSRTRQWADVMLRNGNHLLGLLDDILDLSKIEARKMTVEAVDCSPQQLLAEVRSLMSVRADEKKLNLSIEFAGLIPETVKTDPTRIRQILINLVSNAIKFTDTGGVTVRCRLDAAAVEPRLRVDIIDTGLGMTPEQLQRVFAPFTQADESHTRLFGGSGLGLTISKQLALMLGGDVSAQSVAGRGSTFTFTFGTGSLDGIAMTEPALASAAATSSLETPADPMAGNRIQSPARSLGGVRILLADDGIDNRLMIELLLDRAGAIVTSVDDGAAAVRAATEAAKTRPFDIVLIDMEMPTLDGYAATRKLREAGYADPIVALTANAMCGEREKCLAAGCDDYATKPVNRRLLLATLAKWKPQHDGCRATPNAEPPADMCTEMPTATLPNIAA